MLQALLVNKKLKNTGLIEGESEPPNGYMVQIIL